MIEINQSIGAPLPVMRQMVETKQLRHPVLWDDECRNTKAYGIEMWPFVYLIGTDGKVFWEGNPTRWIRREEHVKAMRALIERKLVEAHGAEAYHFFDFGSPESSLEYRSVDYETVPCLDENHSH